MKKLVLLFILTGFALASQGQRTLWADTFNISTLTGTDSLFYMPVTKRIYGSPFSCEIEYSGLSQDDWTFAIGYSNEATLGDSYNEDSHADFPFTMNATSDAYTNHNGSSVATKLFNQQDPLVNRWLIIKITAGTGGTGRINWRILQK